MCKLLENLPGINQRRDKIPPLICMFFSLLSFLQNGEQMKKGKDPSFCKLP